MCKKKVQVLCEEISTDETLKSEPLLMRWERMEYKDAVLERDLYWPESIMHVKLDYFKNKPILPETPELAQKNNADYLDRFVYKPQVLTNETKEKEL
jgi:hypothetical protein